VPNPLYDRIMAMLAADPSVAADPAVQKVIAGATGGAAAPVTPATAAATSPIAPADFMGTPGLKEYISGWQKYLRGGGSPEGAVAGASRIQDPRQAQLGQGLPTSVRRNDQAGNPRAGAVYDSVVQPDGTVSHIYYGLKRGDSPLVVRLRNRAWGGTATPSERMGATSANPAGDTGGAAAPVTPAEDLAPDVMRAAGPAGVGGAASVITNALAGANVAGGVAGPEIRRRRRR
jgi:hypothetical protein